MGGCYSGMKIDEHPKLMALICTAVGVAGIGLILTIAFNDNDTLMGVGIALGVFGVAATILGCIHMSSASALADSKKNDDALGVEKTGTGSIAPNKIPSPFDVSKGKIRGVDDDASPSPTRIPPPTDPERTVSLVGETRWAGAAGASPARGIIPDGSAAPALMQQQQLVATREREVPAGTFFNASVRANNSAPNSESPAPTRGGGSGVAAGGLVLSPFERRSYPVPQGVFNATPSGAAGAGLMSSAAFTGRPQRPQSFEVDTGASASNGYDARTSGELIRQYRGDVDAVYGAQHDPRNSRGTADDDDDDALPSNYWADRGAGVSSTRR